MSALFKYPRTKHLPFSEKKGDDDKVLADDSAFHGEEVIGTLKMDGENTSIYPHNSHARSKDSDKDSEDRKWIELFRTMKISGQIPENFRICGENMFYKHQVPYNELKSYFLAFSIWEENNCLSWKDTLVMCQNLGIETVPVIYEGIYDAEKIKKAFSEIQKVKPSEGFVIRKTNSFEFDKFQENVAKFVSNSFVLPDKHWRHSAKERNGLIYEDYWNIR